MRFERGEGGLQDRVAALNRASTAWAEAHCEERVGLRVCVARPLRALLRAYIGEGRWRQGVCGLIGATVAMYEAFVCAAKLWERQRVDRRARDLHRQLEGDGGDRADGSFAGR